MRASPRRLISVSVVAGAVLAAVAAPALADGSGSSEPAAAKSPRSVVRDTKPNWTTYSPRVATAPAGKTVNARVFLASRNEDALAQAVTAVSDPASPSYGHYITPEQFRSTYGPAPDAATKVTKWLRSAGMSVSAPQSNGRYVDVSGTVASAQKAFGQSLSLF